MHKAGGMPPLPVNRFQYTSVLQYTCVHFSTQPPTGRLEVSGGSKRPYKRSTQTNTRILDCFPVLIFNCLVGQDKVLTTSRDTLVILRPFGGKVEKGSKLDQCYEFKVHE